MTLSNFPGLLWYSQTYSFIFILFTWAVNFSLTLLADCHSASVTGNHIFSTFSLSGCICLCWVRCIMCSNFHSHCFFLNTIAFNLFCWCRKVNTNECRYDLCEADCAVRSAVNVEELTTSVNFNSYFCAPAGSLQEGSWSAQGQVHFFGWSSWNRAGQESGPSAQWCKQNNFKLVLNMVTHYLWSVWSRYE